MELEELRANLSEIVVTLVGFSAFFRVFRNRDRVADGHSDARLLVIIEVGLVAIAACYLPELMESWGITEAASVKIASAMLALYWIRLLILVVRIRKEQHATPITFRVVAIMHAIVFGTSVTNAIWCGSDTLYTSTVFLGLVVVGTAFWAQFTAERR